MKKLLLIFLILILAGCGRAPAADPHPATTKDIKRIQAEIVLPAEKLYAEYLAKEKPIEAEKVPEAEKYRKLASLVNSGYLAKMQEYQKQLNSEHAMKMTSGYFSAARGYMNGMVKRLDLVAQGVIEKDARKQKSLLGSRRWYEVRTVLEAKMACNREYSMFVDGKEQYALTLENYRKIRKGDTYEKIREYFKMPGDHSWRIRETDKDKKVITHDIYTWQHGNMYVTVQFDNWRAVGWRQRGLDGWK